jgi:RNA ligase
LEDWKVGFGGRVSALQTISDIQDLARQGFDDWQRYGYVYARQKGDLLLFNYTAQAQYEGRWNFFERVSRGLIINAKTGEVAARPFDKIFNWGERGHKAHGHIVTVTEKMDGSLGILYRDDGHKISTRGAFDSEQAKWATDFLRDCYDLDGLPNELTLLFEIIYSENRIVVDYGNREDLVLLAARNRHSGQYLPFYPDLYELAQKYGFPTPKVYQFNNIAEIIAQTGLIDVNQEGWVAEFSDGSRFKFKGDRYLELHRLISGLSFKNTLAAVMSGTIEEVREIIPDEFLGEMNEWVAEIESTVNQLKKQIQTAFEEAPKGSRKEFALWVQQKHPQLAAYLFAYLDARDIEPLIYKFAFRDRSSDQ